MNHICNNVKYYVSIKKLNYPKGNKMSFIIENLSSVVDSQLYIITHNL